MKGLTEETGMMSHSKKKNKDMPSSQQKKKHQITYLAFRVRQIVLRKLAKYKLFSDTTDTKAYIAILLRRCSFRIQTKWFKLWITFFVPDIG